ncbi:polysaccharide pyruvyl transferase family protein [Colwelliaceae bacterium 6441]
MKVLLVNAWHDDNRGDAALVHSAIQLLKGKYPHAQISILSMIPKTHEYWYKAHNSIKKSHGEIELIPSPLPMDAGSISFLDLPKMLAAFLSIYFPFFSRFSGFHKYIAQSDLIVGVGGHYLFTINNNAKSLFRLLRLTQPFKLANHLGIKTTLFSQSLGPFHGAAAQKNMKSIFDQSKVIVREALSRNLVEQIVGKASDVQIKPDSAFYLGNIEPQSSELNIGEEYCVVTLREPMEGNVTQIRENYLQQMKLAVEGLLSSNKVKKAIVFPHVIGPTELEDDRRISDDFFKLCEHPQVDLLNENLDINSTLSLYKNAKFVIGTRFHSVVFALCQETPAVAISYYGPKAKGIMQYIKMSSLCLDINSINATDINELVTQCLKAEENGEIKKQKERLLEELGSLSFE